MRSVKKVFSYAAVTTGIIASLMILLAFTSVPFRVFYWLGTKNTDLDQQPQAIVLLSGGGMPSEDGLYRTYMATEAALLYPEAKIIVAVPGDTIDPHSSVSLTASELILRGIDSTRIAFETTGTNTRSQVVGIAQKFPKLLDKNIMLVTAPAHLRRAVLSFEKAGFTHVSAFPVFEKVLESNLDFDDNKLGGRENIPDISRNINLRYRFWNYLKLEVDILREFFALAYYKLKGWI